jgi:hypothetical protein
MLSDKIIENESKIIFIAGNAGTNNCQQKIVKQKNWRVNSTYKNE